MSEPQTRFVADRVASVILLIVQALVGAVLSYLGLFIAFFSDSCGASSTCNESLITLGMATPVTVAALCLVISLVWTVKRLVAGRMAWWVPVLWTALSLVGLVLGFVFASAGVTPNA